MPKKQTKGRWADIMVVYCLSLKKYTPNDRTNMIPIYVQPFLYMSIYLSAQNTILIKTINIHRTRCVKFVFDNQSKNSINLSIIVTPLVVLVNFLWGRASDDWGIDAIPPTPLLNLSCVLCTTCPKSIYHLGDNVWHTTFILIHQIS